MAASGFTIEGRPLTLEAARNAINRIRSERGHIDTYDEEQLRKTDVQWQQEYRRKAENYRAVYARYTKTVAEQIYSSKFRLVHELLQNADDAVYPADLPEGPTITFRVRPTELLVESNECGFTLRDVHSICDTGQSSKSGDRSTTGEKGLGFKSVFAIADRVEIRSGWWSFRFEHKRGDDGVGMITPIWTHPEADFSSTGTTCKLQYSDAQDTFIRRLVADFEELPNTIIFGLRTIQNFRVVLEGVLGRSDSISFRKEGGLHDPRVHIKTLLAGDFGDHTQQESVFRLHKHTVADLPTTELRDSTSSDVVLGFEIDKAGRPIIPHQGQHIFAYLPIHRLPQLPFIIHADFILAANREAVPDNDWNESLREGIVDAFASAMRIFCKSFDPISHKWMHYLPTKPMEGFWSPFLVDLRIDVSWESLVKTRRGNLRPAMCVRRLPSWFLHDGQPLLPDYDDDVYISANYGRAENELLKTIGLKRISASEMVDRLEKTLFREPGRIHGVLQGDAWHTAFTALLEKLSTNTVFKARISRLTIIPLKGGTWVTPSSTAESPVYFPLLIDEDSVKIEIPDDLGFRKLDPTAYSIKARLSLYSNLGIKSCHPDRVTREILQRHVQRTRSTGPSEWLKDLEILFWYGRPGLQFPFSDNAVVINGRTITHTDLRAWTHSGKVMSASQLFFPSDSEYNAQKLLERAKPNDFEGFAYLASWYLTSQVSNKICHGTDWMSWLQRCGIKYYPDLTTRVSNRTFGSSTASLSLPMRLIARDNAEKFVATLKEHWSVYKADAAVVATELGQVPVPCQDGIKRPLNSTVLPTTEIVQKSRELELEHTLALLKLPEHYGVIAKDEWSFLAQFNVICEINIAYYIVGLRALKGLTKTLESAVSIAATIYGGIAECAKGSDGAMLTRIFQQEELILSGTDGQPSWNFSSACVWQGPDFLTTVQVLSTLYASHKTAATFFKMFLVMRDADHDDLLRELNAMRHGTGRARKSAGKTLPVLYSRLSEIGRAEKKIEYIRNTVETSGLIFAKTCWLKPSECLWNCTVEVSGLVPLDQIYPKLKQFFVKDMGVRVMDVDVLLQELAKAARAQRPNIAEIKAIIVAIGKTRAADSTGNVDKQGLDRLKRTPFLPVRKPDGVYLCGIHDDFSIEDHERYGDAFRGKAKVMDFEFKQLTTLHPFFQLLSLEHRYMSRLVNSHTTVESFSISEGLTRHLRACSYALSCCAVSNKSSSYFDRQTFMHERLLNAEVHVCDKMHTELTLVQMDSPITAKSDRAVVKIDVRQDAVHIFVPSDIEGLSSCYRTELPGQLARALGIEDLGATKVVYRLLNDPPGDLEKVMEAEDLTRYEWLSRPPPQQVPSVHAVNRAASGTDSTHTPEVIDSVSSSTIAVISQQAREEVQRADIPVPVHINNSLGALYEEPVWQREGRNQQYRKLLQEVVRQGRRVTRASASPLSLAEIDEALDHLDGQPDYAAFRLSFGGDATFNANARLGAAGELFVFERLRALGITDFTIANWQSSIRHFADAHTDYAAVPPWTGREVSDIMYHGASSEMQAFLATHAHPHPHPQFLDTAPAQRVHYHIEVKTTAGPCSQPFFMSQNQYRLMKQLACDNTASAAPPAVFVIVRVYDLCSANIQLQVYANPWRLQDGVLEFVADPWKVVPQHAG